MAHGTKGFTLIELMVAAAIVAILAAIALPSYHEYVRKSRRNEAREAVMATAAALERYFLNTNSYTTTIGSGGVTGTGLTQVGSSWRTRNGFYTVAIENNGTTWSVTATATGTQLADTECALFRYALNGGPAAADNGGADTTQRCWD